MILPLQHRLRASLASAIERAYGLGPASLPPIVIAYPPTRDLGDLASPIAFELARRLRKAPQVIAGELAAALDPIEGVARVDARAGGYLNCYLDRPGLQRAMTAAAPPLAPTGAPKVIVEHTAINPNKAAHVGHLRNAALGDTLVRLLRYQGGLVEVQNYIDDTGVQVADVVVGFQRIEGRSVDDVRRLAEQPRFDFYCWDLYARVTEWYGADTGRRQARAQALQAIEHGRGESAGIARIVADRIVRRHLETMRRMNVDYDLLTWEGDILGLDFWARAFEILKAAGAVFQQTEGRLAGCWVMRILEDTAEPAGGERGGPADAEAADPAATEEDQEPREKVIVRSDGTVTYVGKDIAYQFWKFGLLGKDFGYRVFDHRSDGRVLWATTAGPSSPDIAAPTFGGAAAVYNVIDTRQSYLQKLLKQALTALGYTEAAEGSFHFAYEMVTLSPATARELGYVADGEDRAFVEVSGRKGLGVKADDLLDRLVQHAAGEVAARNPDMPAGDIARTAELIACAAVRYFMIKFSRSKVIVFDIGEALSFEGESGPYLQYSAVRAANIFHKLRERDDIDEQAVIGALDTLSTAGIAEGAEADQLWELILEASRLDEVADHAVRTLELSGLAKYAFGLAQRFNAFYHRYPILHEEQREPRMWRAAAACCFRRQITRALDLMGCAVPARM
jgi:arginyl-tRNA synthetase